MIGLALSIDFALLYINRFREELNHHSVEQAIKITNGTAGRAIGFFWIMCRAWVIRNARVSG